MKTFINNPATIKVTLMIAVILGFNLNILFAANLIDGGLVNRNSICVICNTGIATILKDGLLNEVRILAPTTPAEATFTDEAVDQEFNLAPTTPAEASFDDDPGFASTFNVEDLAPRTPAEADFND